MSLRKRELGLWLAVVAALVLAGTAAAADVKLASPFTDHMVLQRGRSIAVWGEAGPGASVEVTLGDDRQAATADGEGRWKASLKARGAGLEPLTLRVASGGVEAVVRDVLVGDVWLCAGQSNMQMPLREAQGGEAEAKEAARHTRLRLLTVPKWPADKPRAAFDAKWRECSPASAGAFSAVGYFFGRELLEAPGMGEVPVGLIDCSFGGTAAEAWTSAEGLAASRADDLLPSMFGIKPGHISNGMVAPLVPLGLRGVLWYQGESNTSRADLYPRVLGAMIADWRKRFDDPDLPFLIVQLPPFTDPRFAWVREAQAEVARATPDVAMAVTIDTTDGFDLHPKEKREVGRRLALLARSRVYEEAVVARGPSFKAARAEGAALRVTFDTGGDGLAGGAGGAGGAVKGFAVAGEDGAYRFADAMVEGDDVVLRCDAVPRPKTVRYAWAGIPEAGLRNRSGLPAAPFRTDDLPRRAFEVQKQPAGRRFATGSYEVEVSGEGKVTSLGVGGKQFLSNALGGAGGTSIPGFFGPRALPDIRAVGPEVLSCGDSDVTLTLAFKESSMEWTIANRGKDEVRFRVALATRVDIGGTPRGDASGPIALSRGKASVSVTGIDSISDGEDGKMLEVVVKGGATRRIAWDMAARR